MRDVAQVQGPHTEQRRHPAMARRVSIFLLLLCGFLSAPSGAAAAGNVNVAALQVALRAGGYYSGTVDGMNGAGTRAGVRSLERHAGLHQANSFRLSAGAIAKNSPSETIPNI